MRQVDSQCVLSWRESWTRCSPKWCNIVQSFRQVSDKFQTSFRQVSDKFQTSFRQSFRQVSYKLKNTVKHSACWVYMKIVWNFVWNLSETCLTLCTILHHPCPIVVHMEPFSSSVFKVLIWIFATTTKICIRQCYTQTYARGLITRSCALLLTVASMYNSSLAP